MEGNVRSSVKKKLLVSCFISCLLSFVFGLCSFYMNLEKISALSAVYQGDLKQEHRRIVNVTNILKAFQHANIQNLSEENFQYVVNKLLHDSSYLLVSYVPQGIVTYSYPKLAKVELGMNLFTHEVTKENAFLVKNGKEIHISGPEPIFLLDNKQGLVVRNPIFTNKEKTDFWGFINVMIDLEGFYKKLDLDKLKSVGIEYKISIINNNNQKEIIETDGFNPIFEQTVKSVFGDQQLILSLSKNFITLFNVYVLLAFFFVSVVVVYQVVSFIEKVEKLIKRSYTDDLTGAWNRKKIEEDMEELIKNNKEFLLILIDLNDFKPVNDNYGHAMGDKLLVAYVKRLKNNLSDDIIVARFGGDEFIVLCKFYTTPYRVEKIVERIKDISSQEFCFDGISLKISASVGLARYPEDKGNIKSLYACADNLMYKDKRLHKVKSKK